MNATDRSLFERFLAVLRYNAQQFAIDVVVLVAWLVIGTEVLRLLGAPRWLQYVVLFGGVLVYAQQTESWEQPPVDEN